MKHVLPANLTANSPAEEFVWERFKEILPDGCISFHNYSVASRQVDVIVLCPPLGVLIMEIKGHMARNIVDVPDNSLIKVNNGPNVPSPWAQANRYWSILVDRLKEAEIESVYVMPAVAYPNITEEEFKDVKLDKISDLEFTFTKESFASEAALLKKIKGIFELGYTYRQVHGLEPFGFKGDIVQKVAEQISPGFELSPETEPIVEPGEEEAAAGTDDLHDRVYSKLLYIRSKKDYPEEFYQGLLNDWQRGTKILVYSPDQPLIDDLQGRIDEQIKGLGLSVRDGFKPGGEGFLYDFSSCAELKVNSFEITNGDVEQLNLHKTELEALDKSSSFNLGQYEIEHAPLDNIVVRAGAGTGKTYSMISRINYLIWKNEYSPADLRRALVMITFTNKATESMQDKLTQNFVKFYLLTKDPVYLAFAEGVADMNISTIHILAKKIIQRYGSWLGLGKGFTVISGEYKRRMHLQRRLDEYLRATPGLGDSFEISMFHLQRRLIGLMSKLDNKNVDIRDPDMDFGTSQHPHFDGLLQVLRETQEEFIEECTKNNTVHLGDLIKRLREVINGLNNAPVPDFHKIDFLFVDEFQDTDDVQIKLLKDFQQFFGYKYFAVGDVKQCIYRFRGAQVEAFDVLGSGITYQLYHLTKNYRTDKRLLYEFNRIFARWDAQELIAYSDKDRLTGTKSLTDRPLIVRQTHSGEDEMWERMIEDIRTTSSELDERRCDKAKIAILVRYNAQIEEVKRMCGKHGVRVETDIDGELFRIHPTIDLYKLVLALKFNRDPACLYNLYTTSYVKDRLPKTALFHKDEAELVSWFYENNPIPNWNAYIKRFRTEPILKVARDLVNAVKPWGTFGRQHGGSDDAECQRYESYYRNNLDQLFEQLIATSNIDYLTLNNMLSYLEVMILTKQEEEARESYDLENSRARVICTTVHKAKGLEFDTVILPFCSFNINSERLRGDIDVIFEGNQVGYCLTGENNDIILSNDHYDNLKTKEQQDRLYEEIRILYVAITRTIRQLIYYSDLDKRKPKYCWDKMIGVR
ncbi:MAG: UvrD-helicase domain-containing protein [Bacillota bacterium]|jgi:DNA helicase-2/ATP-dependent DNA helicase PcrA|nr:UvrD-helicase domain-containing protein [Bacillota bacterium]